MKNYLSAILGARHRSLLYVVRPRTVPENPTPEEINLHQIQLTFPKYNAENSTIYVLLKSLTLETIAYNFVQQ